MKDRVTEIASRLLKKAPAAFFIFLIIASIYFAVSPPRATGMASTNVVISEFRFRGPNGGSDEFIEIYNLSAAPVDISGWKIRGSNNSGTVSTRATVPSGTFLQPGCHYLFTNSSTSGGPYSGAVPGNQTYATGITDDGGVALTLTDDTIIDQVGLSSGSAFKEGTPLASLGSSNLNRGYERKPGGAGGSGTDTDDNASDFQLITPSDPQNSSSGCVTPGTTDPTGVAAANPNPVSPGASTLLTVAVTPGANPTSTGLAVTGDLSVIGGSAAQTFFDDGTNGDASGGDNIFSYTAAVPGATTPGAKILPITISDAQARNGSTSVTLTVQVPVTGDIVISQIYGGGGTSGSTYKNDFVELFNRGTTPVAITGWSVQYASSSGTSWSATALSGLIPPGGYYLVKLGATGGGAVDLPAPDATGTTNMSASSGKVALVSNSTALSGSCPAGGVIDRVGYGAANCFEGGAAAPGLSNTTGGFRARGGCTDSNNNQADFSTGSPNPRNSASPIKDCSIPPPFFAINAIQGSGATSPLLGQEIATSGIVTARKGNGFFLQTVEGQDDADPNTSEGVYVFTGITPSVAAGDAVSVIGIAGEFFNLTQVGAAPADVAVTSSGNPLPAPVTLTTSILDPAGASNQLEKYEGMRMFASSLTSVAPTNEFGEIFAVLTGVARPLREPGIEASFALPPGSPCCVPIFDENPERIMIDTDGQHGATPIDVTSLVELSNVAGPLDFTFGDYKILPDSAPALTANLSAIPVPTPNANEFTIGSFNLENFYSTNSNFASRLNKASLAIRNVMNSPDIIGVEEVGDIATLTALANKVNADSGSPNPNYQPFLIEGDDDVQDDIDVGFLVKASRVTVDSVTQEGADATFIDPVSSLPALLNDRPPLVLRATIQSPTGSTFPVTVIVNHLRSLIDVDQDPGDGPRVREKRRKQAEFLANLVQSLQSENLVLVGDFNAFQFNDGYVDVLGTVKGAPTPVDEVVLASPDLVDPNLTNLVETLPADQRYSFIFQGNPQTIDHVLIDGEMLSRLSRFAYGRNNADFPDAFGADANRPERISDHDLPVAFFTFPPPTANLAITLTDSPDPVLTRATLTYTITVTNSGADNAVNTVVTDNLPANVTFASCNATGGGSCGGTGNNRTVTFPSIAIGATETITIEAIVNNSLPSSTVLTNTASVTSSFPDPDTGNNSATATTEVNKSKKLKPDACVIDLGGGAFTAWFGYDNENDVNITIPVGPDNMFDPAPQDRGQPSTFLPGSHAQAFSVTVSGGEIIWTLDDKKAKASLKHAKACSQ